MTAVTVSTDGVKSAAEDTSAWAPLKIAIYRNLFIAQRGSWALPYVSHFWSLAVEEHFYLLWPVVVGIASRNTLSELRLDDSYSAIRHSAFEAKCS